MKISLCERCRAFGYLGAAIGAVGIIVLFNGVRGGFLYITMQLQPFDSKAFKIVLLGLFVFGIIHFMPNIAHNRLWAVLDIAIRTTIVLTVFMGTVLYFRLSDDISNSFDKNKRRLLRNFVP